MFQCKDFGGNCPKTLHLPRECCGAPMEKRMATMAEFHKNGSKKPFLWNCAATPREEAAKRFLPQAVSYETCVRSAGSRFRGAGLTRERFLPLGQNSRRRPLKLLLAPFCQAQQRFPWPQPRSGILLAMQDLIFRPGSGGKRTPRFCLAH